MNALHELMTRLRTVTPRDLPGIPRCVLHVIADHANDETGLSWPKVETIAFEAGISESTAREALEDLVGAGWLVVVEKATPRNSARYRIGEGGSLADRRRSHPRRVRVPRGGAQGAAVHTPGCRAAALRVPPFTPEAPIEAPKEAPTESAHRALARVAGPDPSLGLPLFQALTDTAATGTPIPRSETRQKPDATTTKKAPKPKKAGGAERACDRYAEAWQKGHAAAGYPVSPPTKNERDLLGMIAATHARYHDGTPITGDALIRWFEEQAEDFRRAFGDVPKIRGGMSPMGFRAWLDDRGAGGRMQAPLAPPKPKRPLDEHEDPDDDAPCPEEDEDFGPPLPPSRTIAILESFGLHEGARAVREAHPELAEEAANG